MASLIIPAEEREKYITNVLGLDRAKKEKQKLKQALSDPTGYLDEAEEKLETIVTDNVKSVFKTIYTMLVDVEDFPEYQARKKAIQIINPYKEALMALFEELYPESYSKLARKSQIKVKLVQGGPEAPEVAAVAAVAAEEEEEN